MQKVVTIDPLTMQAATLGGPACSSLQAGSRAGAHHSQELRWQKLLPLVLSLSRLQHWQASLQLTACGTTF